MHLVVAVVRFEVGGEGVGPLASAFMDDDRTATVWIEPDRKTSRLALDVAGASWEDASSEAVAFVTSVAEAQGVGVEIVSTGRPAVPENLA